MGPPHRKERPLRETGAWFQPPGVQGSVRRLFRLLLGLSAALGPLASLSRVRPHLVSVESCSSEAPLQSLPVSSEEAGNKGANVLTVLSVPAKPGVPVPVSWLFRSLDEGAWASSSLVGDAGSQQVVTKPC